MPMPMLILERMARISLQAVSLGASECQVGAVPPMAKSSATGQLHVISVHAEQQLLKLQAMH